MRRASAVVVAHAIVDDEDARLAEEFWTLSTFGYAIRMLGGTKRNVWMHREVVGHVPQGLVVSHENANKLDNRRANLRVCSYQENRANPMDPQLRNKTRGQVRGVFYDGRVNTTNRWRGKVEVAGVTRRTRRCATEEEAAALLNELRKSLGLRVRDLELRT